MLFEGRWKVPKHNVLSRQDNYYESDRDPDNTVSSWQIHWSLRIYHMLTICSHHCMIYQLPKFLWRERDIQYDIIYYLNQSKTKEDLTFIMDQNIVSKIHRRCSKSGYQSKRKYLIRFKQHTLETRNETEPPGLRMSEAVKGNSMSTRWKLWLVKYDIYIYISLASVTRPKIRKAPNPHTRIFSLK